MTRWRAVAAAVAFAAAVALAAWADAGLAACRGATWATASRADVAACRPPATP